MHTFLQVLKVDGLCLGRSCWIQYCFLKKWISTRIMFYKERCSRETSVPVWKILGSFLNGSLILNENSSQSLLIFCFLMVCSSFFVFYVEQNRERFKQPLKAKPKDIEWERHPDKDNGLWESFAVFITSFFMIRINLTSLAYLSIFVSVLQGFEKD